MITVDKQLKIALFILFAFVHFLYSFTVRNKLLKKEDTRIMYASYCLCSSTLDYTQENTPESPFSRALLLLEGKQTIGYQ